jgi:hypothetical protein
MLDFLQNAIMFSIVAASFNIPASSIGEFQSLHILIKLVFWCFCLFKIIVIRISILR